MFVTGDLTYKSEIAQSQSGNAAALQQLSLVSTSAYILASITHLSIKLEEYYIPHATNYPMEEYQL